MFFKNKDPIKINKSLKITIIKIKIGILGYKPTNRKVQKILSQIGSMMIPNFEFLFNFLAIYPSKKSVIPAKNITSNVVFSKLLIRQYRTRGPKKALDMLKAFDIKSHSQTI